MYPAVAVKQKPEVLDEYLPLAHAVHINPSPDWPARQSAHVASTVVVQATSMCWPGPQVVHGVHPDKPGPALNFPSSQDGQALTPPNEYLEASQPSHVLVNASANMPGPQWSQTAALAAPATVPVAQAVHSVAPKAAYLLGTQSVHPSPSGYEPGSHVTQLDEPAAALNFPPSQDGQTLTPPRECLPISQLVHVLVAASANLPGPQYSHTRLPAAEVRNPFE